MTGAGALTIPAASGRPGVELLTRIAGLLLSAIAAQLVADAIRAFIVQG